MCHPISLALRAMRFARCLGGSHRLPIACNRRAAAPVSQYPVLVPRVTASHPFLFCFSTNSRICGDAAAVKRRRPAPHSNAAFSIPSERPTSTEEGLPVELPDYCSGCGVRLQQLDSERPGFFQVPKKLLQQQQQQPSPDEEGWGNQLVRGISSSGIDEDLPQQPGGDDEQATNDFVEGGGEEWGDDEEEEGGELEGAGRERLQQHEQGPVILCARCYSLRHYGQVKNEAAESALPEFDIGRKVGRKIALTRYRRAVLLCVVDVTDFDGSLPRAALAGVLEFAGRSASSAASDDSEGGPGRSSSSGRRGNVLGAEGDDGLPSGCRLVLAVNKVDLLPSYVKSTRLEQWVRRRAKQGGLPRPASVPLISSTRDKGVGQLLRELQELVGSRGDVWVIGAQNAGKSTCINALRQGAGLPRDRNLTTAVLPGTTLGMLKVDGVLGQRGHLYDTPGVPHAYQLTSRMNLEEVKMLLPRRPLRPRTFRIAAGQSVLIGGVARFDVLESPGATMYLTVWVSGDVVCHLGKTETANERMERLSGTKLTPPLGEVRAKELGPLVPTPVTVRGDSWQSSSSDVAIAGLGWVGVGLTGDAKLQVWTYPGVAITTRPALIPDYAQELERPGFGASDKSGGGSAAPVSGGKEGGGRGGKGGGSGKRAGAGGGGGRGRQQQAGRQR